MPLKKGMFAKKKFLLVIIFITENCTPSSISGVSLDKVTGTSAQTNSITKTNTTTQTQTQTQTKTSTSTSATTTNSTTVTLNASGYPTGSSDDSVLNISLSGTATHYKHKIVTGSGVCTGGGYGSETPIATKITDNISNTTTFPVGSITVCMIGRDASGTYMDETSALSANWTKTYNPVAEASPNFWVRADKGTTTDGSNKVSAWADQSSGGYSVTQTTSGNQPLYVADGGSAMNNKPVIRFAAGQFFDLSNFAQVYPSEVVVVYNIDPSATGYRVIINRDNPSSPGIYLGWSGQNFTPAVYRGAGGSASIYSTAAAAGAASIARFRFDHSSVGISPNGRNETKGPADSTLGNWNHISTTGSGQDFVGDVAEIIIFNRELSQTERHKINAFLALKYNVKSIPSTNQKLWLRADTGLYQTTDCSTTVASVADDPIGCWQDQSGQGNHATQSSAPAKPLLKNNVVNSLPALYFNAAGALDTPSTTAMREVFAIATRPDSNPSPNNRYIFNQVPNGTARFGMVADTSSKISFGQQSGGTYADLFSTTSANSLARVFSMFTDTFTLNLFANGSLLKSGLSPQGNITHGTTPIRVGSYDGATANYKWDGHISEMIAYDTNLNEAERQAVETYLSQKYSTSYTNHPVFNIPNLRSWFKADAGITTSENAAQFTSANSEKLNVADNPALSMGNIDMSIAAWVYLDAKAASQGIAGKWNGNLEYEIIYNQSTDRFSFYVTSDGGSPVGVDFSGLSPASGKWYFVVGIHDSVNNTVGISVDAATLVTAAHTTGIYDGTAPFEVGSSYGGNYLGGRVAKVGVWKKALTASERTELYNGGKGLTFGGLSAGLTSNLVSYWNLVESSGTRNDSYSTNHLADINTVTQAVGPGSSVAAWADQSVNGNNATQSTQSGKPQWIADGGSILNNKPVLRFAGGQYLISSQSAPGTVIMVGRYNNYNTVTATWFSNNDSGSANWGYLAVMDDFVSKYFMSHNGSSWLSASANRDLSPHISSFTLDTGSQNIYLDGASTLTRSGTFTLGGSGLLIGCLSNATANGCWSGSERYLQGDVAELIVYGRVLTTSERQAVECHLSTKYNITLTGISCP